MFAKRRKRRAEVEAPTVVDISLKALLPASARQSCIDITRRAKGKRLRVRLAVLAKMLVLVFSGLLLLKAFHEPEVGFAARVVAGNDLSRLREMTVVHDAIIVAVAPRRGLDPTRNSRLLGDSLWQLRPLVQPLPLLKGETRTSLMSAAADPGTADIPPQKLPMMQEIQPIVQSALPKLAQLARLSQVSSSVLAAGPARARVSALAAGLGLVCQ
jgi:hypothetical protein